MDNQKIKNLLLEIKNDIKNEITEENQDFLNKIKLKIENVEKQITEQPKGLFSMFSKEDDESIKEFEELKKLLESEEWPEAVLDFQIVDESSEEEKMDRAEGIVDILIDENLENKKFLDFGCGEGHMAKYASKEAAISIGFDINKSKKSKFNWEKLEEKMLLTTDFKKVEQQAPYDIILIYDVLDHTDNPIEVLSKAKSLLSENGKIYLRTHPWCGRHGGHLYRQKNKAFVHVVFSDDELKKLGLVYEEKTNKVTHPIASYKLNFIKEAGLNIVSDEIENQEVEDFFEKNPIISKRIKKIIEVDKGKAFPKFQLQQCFHDYVLKR
jgi:2-polyprenyl-3-methyl-5-hydroxy-6-metoxy-1,4-benzoquinol methylase